MGLTEREIFRQLRYTSRRLAEIGKISVQVTTGISEGNYPSFSEVGREGEQPWQQRLGALERVITLQEILTTDLSPGLNRRLQACQQLTDDLKRAIVGRRRIRVAVKDGLIPKSEQRFIDGVVADLKQQALDQKFVKIPSSKTEILPTQPQPETAVESVPELLLPAFPLTNTQLALDRQFQRPKSREEIMRFLLGNGMPYFIDRITQFFRDFDETPFLYKQFITSFFGHAFEAVGYDRAKEVLKPKHDKPHIISPLDTSQAYLLAHPDKPKFRDPFGFPDGVSGLTTPDGIIIDKHGKLIGGIEITAANLNPENNNGKGEQLESFAPEILIRRLIRILGVNRPADDPNEAFKYLQQQIPGFPNRVYRPREREFNLYVVRPYHHTWVPGINPINVIETEVGATELHELCESILVDARTQYTNRGSIDYQTFTNLK